MPAPAIANVLKSFVVGIGFNVDEQGAKKVDGAIEGVKKRALQLGAVLAGAFGIKALTSDFAAANDAIGKFSQTFGVVPADVAALGQALAKEGGSLEGIIQQLKTLEEFRAGLLVGDAGFISAAGVAGIDPNVITSAKSATDAYKALADQFQRLSPQQRINAAKALGLDEASIRFLSKGTEEVEKLIAAETRLRPLTREMVDISREFNDNMVDLRTNLGAVGDAISTELLPVANELLETFNGLLTDEINPIDDFFDKATEAAEEFKSVIDGIVGGLDNIKNSTIDFLTKPIQPGAADSIGGSPFFLPGPGGAAAQKGFTFGVPGSANKVSPPISGTNSGGAFDPIFDLFSSPPPSTNQSTPSGDSSSLSPSHSSLAQRRFGVRSGGVKIVNNVILDGRVIDQKVVDVTEQLNRQSLDEIESSTGG